ncbi:MAG: hypothetical protein KTR17_04740 [Cellvibrionaceae bacterium]|nr:hypothetical protein [Cellvibrionaceae bacterium]
MRAIAEYIVRGRSQAVIVALVGSWVPILTQATLSLVALRKGPNEGLLVTLWALLPALATIWFGDISLVLAISSVAAILISLAGATVLRFTVSWPATLACFVAMSSLSAVVAVVISEDIVAEMRTFVAQLTKGADPEDVKRLFSIWTVTWWAGLVAFWTAVSALIGLIVGRWWQAMLFNPGGFREEFHGLRLTSPLAVVCGGAMFYCNALGAEYYYWSKVFALPLVIAGLGLMHAAIAKHRLGGPSVVLAYMGLLLPPVQLLLALFGLTDVWLNYRKKFNLVQ